MDSVGLTPEMERVLADARTYDDWFSISHHPMSPVRARHQTVKALYRRGYLERLERARYRADMALVIGYDILYRFKGVDHA